jgi:putative MATE family efflux protein
MEKKLTSASNGKKIVDLTEGSISKNLLRLAWPMILGNLLQNIFNLVDMIFVGRLGAEAIAAVSLSGILLMVVWTALTGLSIGTTAMVSRFFGAKDYETVKESANQVLLLGFITSMILGVLGIVWPKPPLILLGASEEVVLLSVPYIQVVFGGSFTLILTFLISAIFRGVGDAITPVKIWTVASILNIILDPLLIFGIGPFPELGILGAAIATVTGQGIGLILAFYFLLKGHSYIKIDWRKYKINLDIIKRIVFIAVPGSMNGFFRSTSSLILMKFVAVYGTIAIAAYGIGLRLLLMVMMPGWAIGSAAATLIGQNLGANKPARAEKSGWLAIVLYGALLTIVGLIFYVFAEQVIKIFNSDLEVVKTGTTYLRIIAVSYPFIALGIIPSMCLGGAGDTKSTMIVIGFSLIVLQIPLAIWLPRVYNLGIVGIWIAITSSYILQGILMTLVYKLGKWKLKKI